VEDSVTKPLPAPKQELLLAITVVAKVMSPVIVLKNRKPNPVTSAVRKGISRESALKATIPAARAEEEEEAAMEGAVPNVIVAAKLAILLVLALKTHRAEEEGEVMVEGSLRRLGISLVNLFFFFAPYHSS
jgi:MinD superfamily P-loop ATPase